MVAAIKHDEAVWLASNGEDGPSTSSSTCAWYRPPRMNRNIHPMIERSVQQSAFIMNR